MFRRLSTLAVALGLTFSLGACGETDPNSPGYWIERLKTAERSQAIRKLTEMGDKEGVVDALMAAYKEGRHQDEIAAAFGKIGDRKPIPLLLESLQDPTDPKLAQLAGNILLEWEAGDHSDVYLNIAGNPKLPNEMRYVALKLLAAFPPPLETGEGILLQVLGADPDLQLIHLNGLAAEALGKMGSQKAIDDLVFCLWLDDSNGRNEVSACRLALSRIGGDAVVAKLTETLERKNRKVEARARKYKFHIGGLIEAKAAEILGDMPSANAVDPLIAALTKAEEAPAEVMNDPKRANTFVMGNVQRIISTASTLAAIGDERAVAPLVEIAVSKDRVLEEKLAAVQQLSYLGNPKAVEGLLKNFSVDPHQHDPVSQGFRIQVGITLVNLIDPKDAKSLAQFEKVATGARDKASGWAKEVEGKLEAAAANQKAGLNQELRGYKEWAKNYEEILTKLEAVKSCQEDVSCWVQKLADEQTTLRMLAAYRLLQLSDAKETVAKAFVDRVGEPNLDVRNVVLFGLQRFGDASAVPALKKQRDLDKEEAKKKKDLQGVVYAFDLMIARLERP